MAMIILLRSRHSPIGALDHEIGKGRMPPRFRIPEHNGMAGQTRVIHFACGWVAGQNNFDTGRHD
jgi:hypothetical protein